MNLRLSAHLFVLSVFLCSGGFAGSAEIKDSTGRVVMVPERVERIMAAGPTAAVVLYVLAPEKMVGWPSAPYAVRQESLRAGVEQA